MATIRHVIGPGRRWNLKEDVQRVQDLLKEWGLYRGSAHGHFDRETLEAVRDFQRMFLAAPDGRVTPEGATIWALNGGHQKVLGMLSRAGIGRMPALRRLAQRALIGEGDKVSLFEVFQYLYSGKSAVDASRWSGPGAASVLFGRSAWQPRRPSFGAMGHAERVEHFGSFTFEEHSPGSDDIRVTNPDAKYKIVRVDIPQLKGIPHGNKRSNGRVFAHAKVADQFQALFKAWDEAGLMDRVLMFSGPLAQRYMRGVAHNGSLANLSNHSWGTAIDLNVPWNGLKKRPAQMGWKGCLLELVPIAHQFGFYWGGHFSRLDGMHFEVAKVM